MTTPISLPTDPRFKNLLGLPPFGQLTVESFAGRSPKGCLWLCRCSCGGTKVADVSALLRGRIVRCDGCRNPTIKPDTKECLQCHRVLPFDLDHFAISNQGQFGMRARCKECVKPSVDAFAKTGRLKLRTEVLTHYSGGTPTCICCNETIWEFLALDHIDGGGRKHHAACQGHVLRALRRDNFPPGYRVLCHNCNQCHRTHGYCVHRPPQGFDGTLPLYVKTWRYTPHEYGTLCIRCARQFPRTDAFFGRHSQMKDGLLHVCHDCLRHDAAKRSWINRQKRRLQIFTHYCAGKPACACCGLDTLAFLSIDHIHGGGLKHRKELKGQDVAEWIHRSGYPRGFQTLCYNCNQAAGYYGQCPHKRV